MVPLVPAASRAVPRSRERVLGSPSVVPQSLGNGLCLPIDHSLGTWSYVVCGLKLGRPRDWEWQNTDLFLILAVLVCSNKSDTAAL